MTMSFKTLVIMYMLTPNISWSARRQSKKPLPDCSSGLYLDQVYYEREVLFHHTGKPFNLVLHRFTGLLFFSYTVTNETHIDFQIAVCSMESRNCSDVAGIPGGYAVAYDALNDDVYFGGHDGIYKFVFLTNEAEFFAEDGKSILDIFVRKHFYYILYPTLSLYVYNGDTFTKVHEAIGLKIERFFIANNKDIYYTNETGLCKIDQQTRTLVFLNDDVKVKQLAEDKFGDVYLATDKGIYVEMNPGFRLKKLVAINQTYGLTFDLNDNIIYSDADGIYRLTQSDNAIHCHFRRKYNVVLGL